MEIEFRSDVGKLREHNEDVGDYFLSDDLQLAIVADGMGGHKAGDVASDLALQTLREAWQQAIPAAQEGVIKEWLLTSITEANRRIFQQSLEHEEMRGMGTTIVCAILLGEALITAHVGDSRIYQMANGKTKQLTSDHTLVNELVKTGQITEDEAEVHPRKNVVTRALGTEQEIDIEIGSYSIEDDDIILICSDGLSDKISAHELSNMLINRKQRLADTADELVALALARGGEDNITFILLQQGERES